ncbi:hypothetical protein ACW4TU_23855 [Streptomyces sp. QTS52]
MGLRTRLASASAVGLLALAGTLGTAGAASAVSPQAPSPARAGSGGVGTQTAGTYYATTWASTNNRTCAYTSCGIRSVLSANVTYVVNCWVYGQTITAEGYTNNIWLQVRYTDNSVGYSSAIYFKGDNRGNLPANANC